MTGWLLAFYCETKTHAGGEESIGSVDLPIQRDPITNHPEWHESTVKGATKAHLRSIGKEPLGHAAFGPDPKSGADTATGASVIGSGTVALLPFPTSRNTFWWLTSPLALAAIGRSAETVGHSGPPLITVQRGKDGIWAKPEGSLLVGGDVELSFGSDKQAMSQLAEWFLELMPTSSGYETFRRKLSEQHIALIDDNVFSFLCNTQQIIQPRNVLDENKKSGNLWYTEFLPAESLMITTLRPKPNASAEHTDQVAAALRQSDLLQIGGLESLDVGRVRVTVHGGVNQ